MITIAIVAILASIAVPSYIDYIRRGQIQEAFGFLSDFRTKMEQYYQDNRSYANGAACGTALPAAPDAKYFTYTCALDTTAGAAAGQSYKLTAAGAAASNVNGFTFTINEKNVHATTSMPSAWGSLPANSATVWIDKKP